MINVLGLKILSVVEQNNQREHFIYFNLDFCEYVGDPFCVFLLFVSLLPWKSCVLSASLWVPLNLSQRVKYWPTKLRFS